MLRKLIAVARDPVLWIYTAVVAVILISGFGSAFAAVPAPVVAATPITIPWGNLLSQLLVQTSPLILGLVSFLLFWIYSKLPAQVVVWLKALHADILLNRAVNQAIALVEGATKGKQVNVTIANQLISTAINLLVQDAPTLIAEWGPRVDQIVAGKLADLNMLPSDASAQTLKITPTVATAPAVAVTASTKS